MKNIIFFLFGLCIGLAIPCKNKPGTNLADGQHYQYSIGGTGRKYLEDLWTKSVDLEESARYIPHLMNIYHLFTRTNPSLSQILKYNNATSLTKSFYNSSCRTVVLLHGWLDTVTSDFNAAIIPAYLEAEDVNIIAVDWSNGAGSINYPVAVINTPTSGRAVAKFITWLNKLSGSVLDKYHIIGHGLGAHQAGLVGRLLRGKVGYITALDADFPGWLTNEDRFKSNDGAYTEAIHTNAGLLGYLSPLADSDFYPNGGINMPGCLSQECDHNRSFFYFAESVRNGGFASTECYSLAAAMSGQCYLSDSQGSDTLHMGGTMPKTGQSGIYFVRTNAFPPFSRT